MNNSLEDAVKNIVLGEFGLMCEPVFEPTDEAFGDLSTNVALQMSGKVGRPPREVADIIKEKLSKLESVGEVSVAGPGFINIKLKLEAHSVIVDEILSIGDEYGKTNTLQGMSVITEYSDPNPFKVLHAGHLYTSLVGDAISNLANYAGAEVHRVNFGGDVGLHVGKAMWAIIKNLDGEHPDKLSQISEEDRLDWVSARYIEGNEAYESDEAAKSGIVEANKRVYQIHASSDKTSAFAEIYWTCRQWSYDGFNALYEKLSMHPFEKYYPESVTTPMGLETVSEGLSRGIFEESDGAVVYKGEKDGLHTRVFLTSEGLPTYEAKDLGLALNKWQDYKFDKNIIITGNDIIEYMKVVQKAVSHFHPEISDRTTHLTHGIVKLSGGVKMSSRKGNILRADDILESAKDAYAKTTGNENWDAVLAAVKYAFLKQRIGGDIIYNPEESVSITGNSGPYLQYAHARAKSIVSKSQSSTSYAGDGSEVPLLKKLAEYKRVIHKAVEEMMPHHVANYLFELAQEFNSFYERERVIGSEREGDRLRLVAAYAQVLKNGLSILGIKAPERM